MESIQRAGSDVGLESLLIPWVGLKALHGVGNFSWWGGTVQINQVEVTLPKK